MEEDRRNPRRPFDAALIANYLQGRKIEALDLFPLGKSNTNYRLTLSDGTVCVVRLHSSPAVAKRENAILKLVKTIVPVPEVLAQGEGWSIHSFLHGTVLANAPQCLRATAQALAKIASLRFDAQGWIQADGSLSPFDFGDGRNFLESMLDGDAVRAWLGPKAIAALRDIDARQKKEEAFCLVHGDFNPTNILVDNGEVTGILDWEFSHAGSRYMDIGNLLRHTESAFHDQIEEGLRDGESPLPSDWKERAEAMDLGAHLEFLTTQRSDDFKRQCVRWVHDFIDRYKP